MKTLLLWPLFVMFVSPIQDPAAPPASSPVAVLDFTWFPTRQKVKPAAAASATASPAPAMIPANKNFQRNARINDPAGARDPNEDTLDGRSAMLDKIVQESRAPKVGTSDGFSYVVDIQNGSKEVIEILFWEYQFASSSNPADVTRRQFLCGVNIKPGKKKELRAFGIAGPGEVISVEDLSSRSGKGMRENVVINRVEFAGGSVWQRKDWSSNEIEAAYRRAMETPWDPSEMCRGL